MVVYIGVTGLVGATKRTLLELLSDGVPHTSNELTEKSGLTGNAVVNCLHRLWKAEVILRTEKPTYDPIQLFKGRAGIRKNTRAYHRYLYRPDKESFSAQGTRFVKYRKRYLDKRGSGTSKARLIRTFLQDNSDRAFYSTEIARMLQDKNIEQQDVMSAVRRAERKGLVYVRGYRTDNRQTPFRDGYLITWIASDLIRDKALEEAIQRTNKKLEASHQQAPSSNECILFVTPSSKVRSSGI